MTTLKTTIATATTTLSNIESGQKVTAATILESYNALATLIGEKHVNKFPSKPKAIERLNAVLDSAKQKLKAQEKADKKNAKDKTPKADKNTDKKQPKKRTGRVGLLCTTFTKDEKTGKEIAATPDKMCQIKISTFKNATKIELNKQPSEPQRKWLVKLECWDKTSIVAPTES